jgi:hypothetical protein
VRVSFLTEFADDLGVVELVVGEEIFGVLVDVDLDFGEGVVDPGDLVALGDSGVQPALKHSNLVSLFEFVDQRFDRTVASDVVEDLFDVNLIAF